MEVRIQYGADHGPVSELGSRNIQSIGLHRHLQFRCPHHKGIHEQPHNSKESINRDTNLAARNERLGSLTIATPSVRVGLVARGGRSKRR